MRRYVDKFLGVLVSQYTSLTEYQIVTDFDDCNLLSEVLAGLNRGNKGKLLGLTDWEQDESWWGSKDGLRFTAANKTARELGAEIERVYVYRTGADADRKPTESMLASMREQYDAKIDVYFVTEAELKAKGLQHGSSQCVVFSANNRGRKLAWLTYNVDKEDLEHPMQNIFSVHQDKIDSNEALLESCKKAATKYDHTSFS